MWIELTLLVIAGIFIFLYNSLAMKRNELRKLQFHMRVLLRHRNQLAGGAAIPEDIALAELLARDAALTAPAHEPETELFQRDGELIETLRSKYNETVTRCNPAFRSRFARFFRFQEWPLL